MFTGIVEERGTVAQPGTRLGVRATKVAEDAEPGASISVNGVCLTVLDRTSNGDGSTLWFDLADETLRRSSLGALRAGDPVNLERPITLLSRLGGHLVQGHVDGMGRIAAVRPVDTGVEMSFEVPHDLMPYIVEKGSVAVDGISLTVADLGAHGFGVALLPFTLQATTLGVKGTGDPVNIEVDVMARYAESLLRRDT